MRAMRPHRAAKFRGPPNSTAPVTGAQAGAKVLSSQTESDTNSSDVDGLGLFDELRTLRNIMPDSVDSLLGLLRYLHSTRLHEVFPNVSVALGVVLTIPVTVASGERSFSKLKLIKTYLRASMKQERLNGLALLSTENAVAI